MTVALAATQIAIVTAQIGRAPRDPWRVAARCDHGFPQTIASPAMLADGARFPNLVWLTCPYLAQKASAEESDGATARWAHRAAEEPALAARLQALDLAVRQARAAETGVDPCGDVGIAGQADPLGVKCLHAHVALALSGFEDPIGAELLGVWGDRCDDARCLSLAGGEGDS